ncbi:MAG TPA: Holliday junction branch migration DNA helicase RuvB [Spirochaetales bacterium]|nr:Holliday junction branch migration DNA helicase RuvB [Spirochaetales bacterium]HPE36450.1 Holliday junction branch migration DNA helicase RuvB [Spirochaetales bacterium]
MDATTIVSGAYQPGEDERENVLRPRFLSEFLGQAGVKDNLAVFIQAAKNRGEALDHVFLIGPPGLGKTTLAGILSRELDVEFKVTSAPALEKPKDLAGILTTLSPRSVFFIDEVHRLKPAIEEMLYMAMEDGELDFIIGQGPSARTLRIPLPPFTLVGATTRAGMVGSPLVSRFGINVRLGFYDKTDMVAILSRSAAILGMALDIDAAGLLADASRGTPRVANRLLRRMRDFAQVDGKATVDADVVRRGLGRLEVDAYGLERHDRDVLATIIEKFGGGPVGAETLAVSTSESVETLEDYLEPYLIQAGFLMRTPRGRIATPLAYRHLGYAPKHEDNGFQF